MFVDKAQITIKAGNGGNGCCSFRREAFIPKGGPNGGDGGNGGNVVFVAAPGEQTLQDFLYTRRFAAENGIPGKGKDMHGRRGKDLKIKVPPGTIVKNAETGEIMADIDAIDKEVVVARSVVSVVGTGTSPPISMTASRPVSVVTLGRERSLALPSLTRAWRFAS